MKPFFSILFLTSSLGLFFALPQESGHPAAPDQTFFWNQVLIEGTNEWFSVAYLDRAGKEFLSKAYPAFPSNKIGGIISVPLDKSQYIANIRYGQGLGKTSWWVYFDNTGHIVKQSADMSVDSVGLPNDPPSPLPKSIRDIPYNPP